MIVFKTMNNLNSFLLFIYSYYLFFFKYRLNFKILVEKFCI